MMERVSCKMKLKTLHELVAGDDDEDSTTLVVPPAAKEALALVPRACYITQASTYILRAGVFSFIRSSWP